ncbi:hypothetical protein OK016_12885 [Vibrio chagasii]|nr:hypothetical protein [Vibrio chagasii]
MVYKWRFAEDTLNESGFANRPVNECAPYHHTEGAVVVMPDIIRVAGWS